jgi:hypothetical protein
MRRAAQSSERIGDEKKTMEESRPEEVSAYLRELAHPMRSVVLATRKVVLAASPSIGERIKWNAPSFFYTGPMRPTDPKKYVRYLLVFNVFRKDCLRLVFLHAADIPDPTAFLEGSYPDGRRLALLSSLGDVRARAGALRSVLRAQIARLKANHAN